MKKDSGFSMECNELITQHMHGYSWQFLPAEAGRGFAKTIALDSELTLIDTYYSPGKNLRIASRVAHSQPRLIVTFCLQGCSRFTGQSGDEIHFTEGFMSISQFIASTGVREYKSNTTVRQLRFSIGKDWLDRYFGEHKTALLFNRSESLVITRQPISSQTLGLVWRMATWSSSEEFKPLSLHGLALNILAIELEKLFINRSSYPNQSSRHDQLLANRARDILLGEFKSPPSIADLSKRVGTNPFKLKRLFHQCFNDTPYNLLTQYRMNQAYSLLETGHAQVSRVADLVGYHHSGNFSSAFKKHFGISPKSVSQKNIILE